MVQPDEIIRSNRKTLALSIDPFGRLIVRAPKNCGIERIFAFIREKEDWILRKKSETAGTGMRLPPEDLHGYSFLLLGETCKIFLDDKQNIRYEKENGRLYLPRKNARKELTKGLKERAVEILTARTQSWAKRMGVDYASLTVNSAKTRWGSCSGKNDLRYSFRLLYTPMLIIDYVVVHELAHIRHKNHSRAFWAEVEKFIPDWKIRRAWLKRNRALMEIF